jgi:uncharacterized protein YhfF
MWTMQVTPTTRQSSTFTWLHRMGNEDMQEQSTVSVTFTFGDSEELCNELLGLVRSGHKTATCDALRAFGAEGDAMPVVGRRDIALNWGGTPALILETLDVTQTRFCDVDESFALAEGENDDLEGWRRDHRQYFERSGGFDNEMVLVCERFKLISGVGPQQASDK